jgi:3'-phosphoadenosine 5'-phosphosulfate sulfotransferase (PAPS reductase)/FAD synthetase
MTLTWEDIPDEDAAPTPLAQIAALSAQQREDRVTRLCVESVNIVRYGVEKYRRNHGIRAYVGMFSGGNDSSTMMHLMRPVLTHAGMANTTIGIEQTRQYVRDTCAAWSLPLIEKHPPDTYADLVTGRAKNRTGRNRGEPAWSGGFPGPPMHNFFFHRLKERCFEQIRSELAPNPRYDRVVFIAGRRRQESERRKEVPFYEPWGSAIWVSPLAMWTALDIATYRAMQSEDNPVPRNEVSDLLHMSGECLCGCYARPGELAEIGEWFPEVRDEILALEAEVRASGAPESRCSWGTGSGPGVSNKLCGNCAARAAGV